MAASETGVLPSPARLVLRKFNVLMDEERYKAAVDLLLSFQSRRVSKPNKDAEDPKGYHHPEIYFALGNGYLVQEQYDLAAGAYRQALEMDSRHTSSWLNLAKVSYEQEKYDEAARCFLRGYESSDEKIPERLYYSAASYLMAEQYEKSIEIFEYLFRDHPGQTKPEWKENMVHALLSVDRPKHALPIIIELIGGYEGEKKVRWQEILLYQYLELDMLEEALVYAARLTNVYPDNPRWWKTLAHIHLSEGQYIDALVAMTIYGLLTPLNQEEAKLMADLNMQVGIPVKAVSFYEAALAIDQNERILQNLVTAYQHLEQYEKALNRMEDIDSHKMTPSLVMLRGDLLYAVGRYRDAEKAFRQVAFEQGSLAGRAWLMAGYAAWQAGDLLASRQALKKAAGFPEQERAALEAIRQLKGIQKR